MDRERREPDIIRKKKRRKRSPEEIEEIRRRRRAEQNRLARENDGERPRKKRPVQGEPHDRIKSNGKKKKASIAKRVLLGIAIAFCLLIAYIIIIVINFFGNVKTDTSFAAVDPASGDPVNIVVMGMDVGTVGQESNYSIKRTDTVMVINYNPNTKKTQVVSIPRDTLIKRNGKSYKFNAIYETGGNKAVAETIESLLDIKVNYTINLDYTAFRELIDAIGGIDMTIEQDMIYDDDAQNLHINFKKGTTVHLNGKKAEEFFRWRKNNDGTGFLNGDLDRIQNQHKFLQKVVDKCKSPTILFKAPKIFKAISSNMRTNMSAGNMIYYGLKMMFSMGNGVNMTTIIGEPKYIGGISYVLYNKASNQQLIESLTNGSSSSGSSSSKELDKKDARVLVLNCTSKSGLASEAKSSLAEAGFEDIDVNNGPETSKSIVMTDYDNLKSDVKDILPKLSKSESISSQYPKYDVVILLGSDYLK